MFLVIDEVGKLVNQSAAYNVVETLIVVSVLAFTVFTIYLALEKE